MRLGTCPSARPVDRRLVQDVLCSTRRYPTAIGGLGGRCSARTRVGGLRHAEPAWLAWRATATPNAGGGAGFCAIAVLTDASGMIGSASGGGADQSSCQPSRNWKPPALCTTGKKLSLCSSASASRACCGSWSHASAIKTTTIVLISP